MMKKQSVRLVLLCYGAALALWMAWTLGCFAVDSINRANGTLREQEFTFDTLECGDLEVLSPTRAVSTTADPKLFLTNLDGKVISLSFAISFDKDPGEIALYYARQNEDFSADRRVWSTLQDDGSYAFLLPRFGVEKLRVDPASVLDITLTLRSFTLNAPASLFDYILPDGGQAFHLLVYPGLISVLLGYFLEEFGADLLAKLRRRKEEKPS